MSAVATRTRAAKKTSAPTPTPAATIDQICKLVVEADGLIDQAQQIGDNANRGGMLLRHAIETIVTDVFEKLNPEAFSEETVSDACDALITLEAALAGVQALHRDDGRGLLVDRAIALVTAAADLCDQPQFWPTVPQRSARWHDEARDSFMAGKALAAGMFKATAGLSDGGDASLHATYRGTPSGPVEQVNPARPFVLRLLDSPDWVDGFSAAITDMLVQGFEHNSIEDATARLSYEACTTPSAEENYDGYTAAPLEEQLAAIGIEQAAPAKPAVQSSVQATGAARAASSQDDDVDERRKFARACQFEILELSNAVKLLSDRDVDPVAIDGIMSRMSLLSELTYFALRLSGDPDESVGAPPLSVLRRQYTGMVR